MTTNLERREKIEDLRNQLQADLKALERKFREDSATLEMKCKVAISHVERDIKAAEEQELRAAREQIQKIIADAGLDPAAVFAGLSGARGAQKSPKAPITRKPQAPSNIRHTGPNGKIWNGRGRMPRWFKEQQDATSAQQHH
jgi:DNA-binding protein H-NS